MRATKSEAVRAVMHAINVGIVVSHADMTVGPYRVAVGYAPPFAIFVDRGILIGRHTYGLAKDAAEEFVRYVGPAAAFDLVREARERRGDVDASPLDDSPVKTGARLSVVTGSRTLGIEKGTSLSVDTVRLRERNEVAVRVMALNGHASGKSFTLHARHVNRLSEPEFSLGDGTGTNKIVVRVSRAAR